MLLGGGVKSRHTRRGRRRHTRTGGGGEGGGDANVLYVGLLLPRLSDLHGAASLRNGRAAVPAPHARNRVHGVNPLLAICCSRNSDVLVHVAVAAAITTRVQTSDLERAICGGDAMRAHPSRRSTRWPP
jgi:hypothetical protein